MHFSAVVYAYVVVTVRVNADGVVNVCHIPGAEKS